jgi:hypothetical protein
MGVQAQAQTHVPLIGNSKDSRLGLAWMNLWKKISTGLENIGWEEFMSAVKALMGVGRVESESLELDWEAVGVVPGRRTIADINRRGSGYRY